MGIHQELGQFLGGVLGDLRPRHAVHLQRAHSGGNHDAVGAEATVAAGDVEELFGAHVGGEAGLGHGVVAELQGHAVGHDGVVAVGDVGERASVDDRRVAFQGLDQGGLQGVLHQHGHGAGHL